MVPFLWAPSPLLSNPASCDSVARWPAGRPDFVISGRFEKAWPAKNGQPARFLFSKNDFKIAIWSILKSPYLVIWSILENFLVDWHFFIWQRIVLRQGLHVGPLRPTRIGRPLGPDR
jgi:hypothetical protein